MVTGSLVPLIIIGIALTGSGTNTSTPSTTTSTRPQAANLCGSNEAKLTVSTQLRTGEDCFDEIIQSWLPSDKILCGSNFGFADQEFSLDLPAFDLANNFTRRGADVWLPLTEDEGLKGWLGCGNHPGLVNGTSYCAQTSSTFDVGTFLGDWGVLEGLTPVACFAYSLEETVVSISFDPPLSTEFILPGFPVVLKLFGYTLAPNAEAGGTNDYVLLQ